MTISNEAYKALEDIVGSEYISREPADLDSYCFVWANELIYGDKFSPRPLAVVMPESTEEVSAIVKTCNRFGLKYRAHATGFEVTALSSDTPFIPIDLRRMNSIVEIDAKNKIAVVEPYVSQAKLFQETRKHGLRPLMLSSGPSCSVVAGCAAHFGRGACTISTDYGCRNLLGAEWVLPDGDIVRLGSMGSSGEWINADGPGPSLRGVLRGYGGANGGNGVFTKVATKIYPWYGQAETRVIGEGPNYDLEIPENFELYVLSFPDMKSINDFHHMIYEESIAFHFQRLAVPFVLGLPTTSNDELYSLLQVIPQELMDSFGPYGASLAIDASSKEELEYKKKVVDEIIDKTEAEEFALDEDQKGALYFHVLTGGKVLRAIFRPGGSFMIAATGDETIDNIGVVGEEVRNEVFSELYESGAVFNATPGLNWQICYGEGSGHVESLLLFDPADSEACKKIATACEKSDHLTPRKGLGINSLENCLSYKESAMKAGMPHNTLDFVKYMKMIKRAIDPNDSADSAFYVSTDEWE
jgi:glycolate oxidase